IRSDLYALGSTWYHLLAGQPPFPKGGLGERLYKLMSEDAADVRQFNPRVSEDTARVLNRLLAKEPADRYQTPVELFEDLVALGEGGRPASRRDALAGLAVGEADVPRRPPSSRSLKKA